MMSRWLLSVIGLLSLTVGHAVAQQPDTLRHAIPPPLTGVQSEAHLGRSVAVEGSYLVVGADLDDFGSQDSGVVKVFDATTGALLHLIPNPVAWNIGLFGTAVAISGTRLIVGAPGDDTGMMDAGSAYVYDLAGATPTVAVAVLNNPSPGMYDRFGRAVAISGTRVVVGAFWDGTGAEGAGSAYVYDLAGATPTVPIAVLNNPAPTTYGYFGYAVGIAGTQVVVGVPGGHVGPINGCAYVYDLGSGTPTVPTLVLANPSLPVGGYGFFGGAVAIFGTRVVVGANEDDTAGANVGSAYVYDLAGGTPTVPVAALHNPSPATFDSFGSAVAISESRVVVGASQEKVGTIRVGEAYVYDVASETPMVPAQVLSNPTPADGDQFGLAVAISGTRVVVGATFDDTGATDAGSAYVFDLAGATPAAPALVLNHPGPAGGDHFGQSVAIFGTWLVVGSPSDDTGAIDAGSVYVFDLASGLPTVPAIVLPNPAPAQGDGFGGQVAISGARVVVGASGDDVGATNAGSAYVYDLAGGTPTIPTTVLSNPSPAANDYFGSAVAVDGTRVIVGASSDDTGASEAGTVYAYDLSSGTPTVPAVVLNNPSPVASDYFGQAVAISGTRLVVGAYRDDTGATDTGAAYVYDLANATPAAPQMTLHNPAPAVNDYFGISVAINGRWLVIGSPNNGTSPTSEGNVYVYDLMGLTPTVPAVLVDNPSPSVDDFFGYSVAISGTRVAVGAIYEDTGDVNAGSIYVYDLAGVPPLVPVAVIHNPAPSRGGGLGLAVALSGTTLAAGTPTNDTVMTDKGGVYTFTPADPDRDHDGLLDLWEEARLGSVTVASAGDDLDGDGLTELQELAFNTDPLFPDIAAASVVVTEAGYLTITLGKRAGVTYAAESAGNLSLGDWSTATTTIITNSATTLKVRDDFPMSGGGTRFLRMKVTAAP